LYDHRRRRRSTRYTPYLYDDYEEGGTGSKDALAVRDQQLYIDVVFKLVGEQ
jgi:hypothetical protein